MSERAAEETGMGNAPDKISKNTAALNNTPGIEDLTTSALTGDGGMVLFELSPLESLALSPQHQSDRNYH
jgi:propionaldehyde dehydrogenase